MYRIAVLTGVMVGAVAANAQDRDTKVRNDRTDVMAAGRWIYNDLDAGYAEAKRSNKPLLIVFR